MKREDAKSKQPCGTMQCMMQRKLVFQIGLVGDISLDEHFDDARLE